MRYRVGVGRVVMSILASGVPVVVAGAATIAALAGLTASIATFSLTDHGSFHASSGSQGLADATVIYHSETTRRLMANMASAGAHYLVDADQAYSFSGVGEGEYVLRSGNMLIGGTPVSGGAEIVYDVIYSSNGTWYKSDCIAAGATSSSTVLIEIWGGGASGGKHTTYGGSGGGGGACHRHWCVLSDLPNSAEVWVGSGGAPITSGSAIGYAGNTSKFGMLYAAGGAPGPAYNSAGGGGGIWGAGVGATGGEPAGGAGGNPGKNSVYGGGGGGSAGVGYGGGHSIYGGGGGGSTKYTNTTEMASGGHSIYGGAGGGGGATTGTPGPGGVSFLCTGHGGYGAKGSDNAGNGYDPGGGGGGSQNGSSGRGGAGRVRVRVWR